MSSALIVEMGETGISQSPDVYLQATGLGACVGLCLYEQTARIAVLVHIVLPQTREAVPTSRISLPPPLPGKCADTAVIHALDQIKRYGGQISRVQAALAGGAQIYTPDGAEASAALSRLEFGPRNVAAVKEALDGARIPLLAEETGGHCGRTITFPIGTGDIWVRRVGLEERLLIGLGLTASALSQHTGKAIAHGH